jgi:hypothetical protein
MQRHRFPSSQLKKLPSNEKVNHLAPLDEIQWGFLYFTVDTPASRLRQEQS